MRFKDFLALGIFLAFLILGLIVTAYVFVWGAIIGGVIYAYLLIKQKLTGEKPSNQGFQGDADFTQVEGNTYDHDEK